MRKPDTINALIETVAAMDHRERIVFECSDALADEYVADTATSIEVYLTLVFSATNQMVIPKNVNVKLTTADGKLIKRADGKPALNKSKYLRLSGVAFFEAIFNAIK